MDSNPARDEHHGNRDRIIIIGIIIAVVAVALAVYAFEEYYPERSVTVIRIDGVIVTGDYYGGGYTGSEYAGKRIRAAANDPMVNAIVLRINSPGGTPAAAQEIIADVKYARAKKPVVVSMGDVAASAAYYISAYADRIYASPDTLTGGIGTSWTFLDVSGWMEKENLTVDVVKSGAMKDMGAEYRPLSPEERAYAGTLVNASFERLMADLLAEREIDRSMIEDARVIRGEEAVRLGMVDALGNLYDAIDGARSLA